MGNECYTKADVQELIDNFDNRVNNYLLNGLINEAGMLIKEKNILVDAMKILFAGEVII